jgi:hypothetical protein
MDMIEEENKMGIVPTQKRSELELELAKIFGKSRPATIMAGSCMTCDTNDIVEADFRDDLSIKEYQISGLCQSCQDDVFGI